jgi:hypothetical protein
LVKPSEERRNKGRELCADFVQITWNDQVGRPISYVGLLEDVSPGGLGMSLDLPLAVGRAVHLHTKGFEGDALVSYCELGDYGYLVGVEFQGCSWDREKWKPQHLLTLP